MGVGIIDRDHEVNVLATMCSTKPFIVDPTIVEGYGAWKTPEFG
jgi:hypothetical protein